MKKTILALILTAGLTSFGGVASASIIYSFDYQYAGSGYVRYPEGASYTPVNNGVVTGTVFGTLENGTLTPTRVTSSYGIINLDISETTASGYDGYGFNVSAGNVSSAYYIIEDSSGRLAFNYSIYHVNGMENNTLFSLSNYGFDNVTYGAVTPVTDTATVPEPSQVAASLLLAAGIAGFVIVRRKKALVA